jgi:hypothetical protein
VAVAINEYFDFALLDDEHAVARIPLPEDYVAIAVLLPQTGHADALTYIFSAHHSVPKLITSVNSGMYLARTARGAVKEIPDSDWRRGITPTGAEQRD